MKTIDWELKVGLFKGLLLGVRHYYRSDESGDYKEEDIVIYIGMVQVILTKIKLNVKKYEYKRKDGRNARTRG